MTKQRRNNRWDKDFLEKLNFGEINGQCVSNKETSENIKEWGTSMQRSEMQAEVTLEMEGRAERSRRNV